MSSRALNWPRTKSALLLKVGLRCMAIYFNEVDFALTRSLSCSSSSSTIRLPSAMDSQQQNSTATLAARFRPPPIGRSTRAPTFRLPAKAMIV